MVTTTFDKAQIKALQNKLAAISDSKVIDAALFVGGETLKRIMAEYPPVNRRPQPFKTDKQRRYVFWAIKQGIIVIPYVRGSNPNSESLKHRWIVRGVPKGVEVANNASYAPLVHSWEKQTTYHKEGGWRTDRDVLTQDKGRIVDDIAAAYFIAVEHIWSAGA